MLNLRCKVKLREDGPQSIEATVINFVPTTSPFNYKPHSSLPCLTANTNALVMLRTFAIGEIHELPINFVKIDEDVVRTIYDRTL